MTQDDLYKAWHSVGADIAGLNFSDFVSYLPAQRPWVGLTEKDISDAWDEYENFQHAMRIIEAKLKAKNFAEEKNT